MQFYLQDVDCYNVKLNEKSCANVKNAKPSYNLQAFMPVDSANYIHLIGLIKKLYKENKTTFDPEIKFHDSMSPIRLIDKYMKPLVVTSYFKDFLRVSIKNQEKREVYDTEDREMVMPNIVFDEREEETNKFLWKIYTMDVLGEIIWSPSFNAIYFILEAVVYKHHKIFKPDQTDVIVNGSNTNKPKDSIRTLRQKLRPNETITPMVTTEDDEGYMSAFTS